MRKQVLGLTIGVLLVLSMFAVLNVWKIKPAQATPLFSDGFEIGGGFDPWTATSGSPSIQNSIVHSGVNASLSTGTGTDLCYEDITAGSPRYARGYFYFHTMPTVDNSVYFMEFYDATLANYTRAQITNSSGTVEWMLYGNGYGGVHSVVTPVVDHWYSVELKHENNVATTGDILYVDGVNVAQYTSDVWDGGRLYTGAFGRTDSISVYWDDVVIDSTYIGPIGDTTAPTYSSPSTNTTQAGQPCNFTVHLADETALANCTFGTNNTGTWTNETKVDISGTSYIANTTKTLNSTVGVVVQWEYWFADSSNNLNNTGLQSVTTTTLSLTVDSLPISVSYTINSTTLGGYSVTAASGSAADIQTAVNAIVALGGNGTVYVPAGSWTWTNPTVGVTIPAGVNVIGAGTAGVNGHYGDVASMNFTINSPSTIINIVMTSNWANTPAIFGVDGQIGGVMTNRSTRISGFEFVGPTPPNAGVENTMGDFALGLIKCVNFRVDHCTFTNWAGSGIGVGANDGRAEAPYVYSFSLGVIDHCYFTDPYKLSGSGWIWGYGVTMGGNCHVQIYNGASTGFPDVWDSNVSDFFGQYHVVPAVTFVMIEDNYFEYMRHCLTSNEGAWYCARWNMMVEVICVYGQRGYIDVHGEDSTGMGGGGRGCEAYNNLIVDSVGGGWGWATNNYGASMRNGAWLFYNNTFIIPTVDSTALCWITNADDTTYVYPERKLNNTYIWGNAFSGNATTEPVVYNDDPTNLVVNVNYFLREPTLALDGFTYTPHTYPLSLSETTGITNSSISLAIGTYLVTVPLYAVSGGVSYNFTQWQDASTNTTLKVSLSTDTTITATYILASEVIPPGGTVITTTEEYYATHMDSAHQLVQTSTGQIYIIYDTSAHIYVETSIDNGLTWVNQTQLDTISGMTMNTGTYSGNLAVDGSNVLYAVWMAKSAVYTNPAIWFSQSSNGYSWTTPIVLSNYTGMSSYTQNGPAIAVDHSDNLHVAWYGEATGYTVDTQIWETDYITSWSTPVLLSTATGMSNYHQAYPSITVDTSNNLDVDWRGGCTANTYSQIWFSQRVSTTWSLPIIISNASGQNGVNLYSPDIAIDSSNMIYASWYGNATATTNNAIWVTNSSDGITWTTPVIVSTYAGMSTGVSSYSEIEASIGIDTLNKVYVFWYGEATGYTSFTVIWVAIYNGAWNTPQCLYNSTVAFEPNVQWSAYPSFNVPSTQINYLFMEGSASPYNIRFASLFPTITGVTITITSPTATTYLEGSYLTISFTASGGAINKYWFNIWTGTAWVYTSNQTYTGSTSILLSSLWLSYTFTAWANNTGGSIGTNSVVFSVESIVITITYPEAITYTVSSIPIEFSATPSTTAIDVKWWNILQGSSWLFAYNITYSGPTSILSLADGTYMLYAWANNTEGTIGQETVMFSVSVTGGIVQITINTWWSGWW
jgi:hypothetical protein